VDGSYPSNESIILSFDVYNVKGDVNYAPNGEYSAIFTGGQNDPSKLGNRPVDNQVSQLEADLVAAQPTLPSDAFNSIVSQLLSIISEPAYACTSTCDAQD